MRQNVVECIAGTTLRVTWVSSGAVPSSLYSRLVSGSEAMVHSATAIDSGNGHFYAVHPVPTSGGWYINEWVGIINANTYVNRQLVRAERLEVD